MANKDKKTGQNKIKNKLLKIIISAILFIIAICVKFPNEIINIIIFILSYLVVGFEILKKGIRNIFKGKVFDENFLMMVATIGAFAIKEYPEAVAVMLFYQVGELFQSYAVDKSRKSITSLMDIRPEYANLLKGKKEKKVDPDDVKIGDIILIKQGEKIPLDGIVIEGNSMLDTKALTGEFIPKIVKEKDEVLSGCINLEGILKVKVTKEYENSTVSRILELVENASSKKSKSENFITKFAKYYTPIVVIIAVILAFIPPLIIKDESFKVWIYRALSFLVVSCPCALVISIQISFFGGIGGASKQGILIKGSNYLEQLAKTEILVFDKTGTLTKGVFRVQEIKSTKLSKEELLEAVAHVESYSNHPIAKSIKQAYGREINLKRVKDAKEITGYGIVAYFDDKEIIVGNEKLMKEMELPYEKQDEVGTIIYTAIDKEFAGTIIISDEIKEDSQNVVSELKKNGIKKAIMLTGDKKKNAKSIAEKLKIDEVYFELLPDQKVKKVEELIDNKNKDVKLAFVGDGINDAPVLALADIGIAMGALGSDSAIEASDIVIMNDEPSKIINAIKLSKKTMRIVRENIIFAIFIKVLVLILTALGISNMWQAVFADVGVSIIAIINALRVLKNKI